MYVVTGITGQVGGAVARHLLSSGRPLRAVVRDHARGQPWAALGGELALADIHDREALARAFAGAEAAFVMVPSSFDPQDGFPEARRLGETLAGALQDAQPGRVVLLSSIGVQATPSNLLTQLSLIEEALRRLPIPMTFLRPGWYIENTQWDIPQARENGVIHSFLQPLDQGFPMVATEDVGRVAAGLLQAPWSGTRIVELAGTEPVSPQMIAGTLARLLARDVRAEAVPQGQWEAMFRAQGMRNPHPRMRMLEGFNEGWIRFEHAPLRGTTPLEAVLRGLLKRTA